MSYVLQEEEEAQAKADKIKLALEKLKEAKVKKVNYESLLHGAVNVDINKRINFKQRPKGKEECSQVDYLESKAIHKAASAKILR